MSVENSVVAIYHTHTDADRAVKELERGGVDMKKLSIVGKGQGNHQNRPGVR